MCEQENKICVNIISIIINIFKAIDEYVYLTLKKCFV